MNKKELVVITGATSGIGKATAKVFSEHGYPLLLIGRRKDRLDELKLPNSITQSVDVTDEAKFRNAIEMGEKEFGPVGCMINNAGMMLLGRVEKQNPQEWKDMFSVNVLSLLTGMQAAASGMIERRFGTIINVSSIAGKKTFPNHAAYCGTKFAVSGITENVREELAEFGVRVISICPGAVETELLSHTTSNEIKSGYQEWKDQMGGVLNAEDVAQSIYFAYAQPQNVCIREIVLAPTKQAP